MRNFILAFPLPVTESEAPQFLENIQVKATSGSIMIPGCTLMFEAFLKPAVQGLIEVFSENDKLSDADAAAIAAHKSLFFLKAQITTVDTLKEVNKVIANILSAGVAGVYFQNSGAAWSAGAFAECEPETYPMDPWLNYIETQNDIFTLGMESFGLPDICVSKLVDKADAVRDLLSSTADALFIEKFPADTGAVLELEEGERFEMMKETRLPFKKTDPEFNKQGAWRLIRKAQAN